jgi:hypothetical protein
MKVGLQALRVSFLVVLLGLGAGASRGADIGPSPQRETPEQAHCKALGDGFFAVKGSTNCIRITGYVAAGIDFVEPGRIAAPATGPFAPHSSPAYSTREGAVAVESQFDTALGPGRLYVQVGGMNSNH